MSYPGYPYYQQGQPQGMPGAGGFPPYPQQPQPGNPSPYPPGQASYSQQPYPSAYPQAPYPYGYGSNTPTQMPQPYNIPMPMQSTPAHSQGGYPSPSSYPQPQAHGCPGYPSAAAHSSDYVPPPSHSSAVYSAPSHAPYASHASTQARKKGTPTVFPADPFDPRADAEVLRRAMKGFGTDEKAIIQVLANRTNVQRLEIERQFKTLYGKDLKKDLKSELSGRFEDLVIAMMTPLPQFYAKEIHDGLSGIGTDEDVLIEVFCTMTNNELRTIQAAYEAMYRTSLESDLMGDTSGTFKRLMVSLCTGNRDESMVVDPGHVTADAQSLLRAGEMRLGTDESTFNAILCQRNYAHLAAVFQEYERITGHQFEKAIKNEFSGDAEEGLLAIVRSVRNKPEFFAKRLHESMKGMGTVDRQLIRLIITRSEVDMGEIKEAYVAKYGKSLEDAISGDTSGDYKKCFLALIS